MTPPPAPSAHALHKRFKLKGAARPVHALDDVTLDVHAGQLTALVGAAVVSSRDKSD